MDFVFYSKQTTYLHGAHIYNETFLSHRNPAILSTVVLIIEHSGVLRTWKKACVYFFLDMPDSNGYCNSLWSLLIKARQTFVKVVQLDLDMKDSLMFSLFLFIIMFCSWKNTYAGNHTTGARGVSRYYGIRGYLDTTNVLYDIQYHQIPTDILPFIKQII